MAGDGNNSSNHIRFTLVVKHAAGVSVDGLKIDENWDGADDTTAEPARAVTSQQPIVQGGFNYSRVTYDLTFDTSGTGFRCIDIFNGPARRTTKPFRVKAQTSDGQTTGVVNANDPDLPYTRTLEFKHLHPERTYLPGKSIIVHEYSSSAEEGDEPYYPINTAADREKLLKYRDLARQEPMVLFGGRLGTYKYLDMHMAIGSALSMFENKLRPHFSGGAELKSGGVDE